MVKKKKKKKKDPEKVQHFREKYDTGSYKEQVQKKKKQVRVGKPPKRK